MKCRIEARVSPLPDVGEVRRPAARQNEQSVDAQLVALAHVARRKLLGGGGDAAQPPLVERECRSAVIGARLDLDERQRASAPGHDVDFANPWFVAEGAEG